MAKKQKVVKIPANKLTIEAVNNGYRVTTNVANELSVSGSVYWISCSSSSGGGRYEHTSGEYVFPDFASLTRWMRDNLKHGKPVKAE